MLCPALIGRSLERDALAATLDAAQGGTVFLLGEPGIGKSRLVRELAEQARGR